MKDIITTLNDADRVSAEEDQQSEKSMPNDLSIQKPLSGWLMHFTTV